MTTVFRSRLPFLAAALVAATVVSAANRPSAVMPPRSATLALEFRAPFLMPAEPDQKPSAEPMRFGPVEWTSTDTGLVAARMWAVNTVVEFKTTNARRDEFDTIVVNSQGQGGTAQLWDVWRHRHGYLLIPNIGYVWNSLSDNKERLSRDDGELYDRFLKGVWSYWALKTLPDQMKKVLRPRDPLSDAVAPNFHENIKVAYDNTGLLKPAECALRITLWDMPVLITFEARPSTAAAGGPDIAFKYHWTYDRGDWRKRHGYKKDLWGYSWNGRFPDMPTLTEETGFKLDELLDRCVSYWVDITAQQLSTDFENEFYALLAREFPQPPVSDGGG